MKTTSPIPHKTKREQWYCEWFRGHVYSINQILTEEEFELYEPFAFHRFCERCGRKEFWSHRTHPCHGLPDHCLAYDCVRCPMQDICKKERKKNE